MNTTSPFLLVKQLEADIVRLLSHLDLPTLQIKEQQGVAQLRNSMVDARLDVQDYELAETREDQLRNAKDAKKRLHTVEQLILANPSNVFGSVEVAQLSAYIGQIVDKLR